MNTNQMGFDSNDVCPEKFFKGSRGEKVSPDNLQRPPFREVLGKKGHALVCRRPNSRDILCLQYIKACAVRACPKQLPRIRPYGWELYRWADENPSADSQFVQVKKVISARYTHFCLGTEHLLSYDVLLCLVYCCGSWHTAFSYPLNILYTFLKIYFIMLSYHNEDVSCFVSLIKTKSKEVTDHRNANQLHHSKIKIN